MSLPVRNLWVMQLTDLSFYQVQVQTDPGKALWRCKYSLQVLALPIIIWPFLAEEQYGDGRLNLRSTV